jgi:hypothetical protein
MNIFALDACPEKAAKYHCDKHVVKMIVEAAQMLSTAHRVLDGEEFTQVQNGRKSRQWKHPEDQLYKVAHLNHPSSIWTRECADNYVWHYWLFCALCNEYTHRYGKVHATDTKLRKTLSQLPSQINRKKSITPFRLAMKSAPECMDELNPVESYRKFYQTKQDRFKMVWTNRQVPSWFHYKSKTTV